MRRLLRVSDRYGRWALIGAYVGAVAIVFLIMSLVEIPPIRVPTQRPSVASGAADLLSAALGIAVITGILAAAIVEVLKRLTGLRGAFQLHELRQYLDESVRRSAATASDHASESGSASAGPRPESPWRQLEKALGDVWPTSEPDTDRSEPVPGGLLRGHARRDPRYFFDLPLEQLMGQLGTALEVALTKPRDYRQLLSGFAGAASADDLKILDDGKLSDPAYVRSQAVINERVQRGLDSLQVIIGHRWRWFVRGIAALLCAILGIVAVEVSAITGSARVLVWIDAAVPGTFFAWLSRDATAVIERWRR